MRLFNLKLMVSHKHNCVFEGSLIALGMSKKVESFARRGKGLELRKRPKTLMCEWVLY